MSSLGVTSRGRLPTAYLLDGVLCETPPPCWLPWGQMRAADRLHRRAELLTHYRRADPLFEPPEGTFYVFSQRRDDPGTRNATSLWLARMYPRRVRGVIYLAFGASPRLAAQMRSLALRTCMASEYTDDSARVLTVLSTIEPGVRLWYWDGELRTGVRP